MKLHCRLIYISLFLLLLTSCDPFYGNIQKEVPHEPLQIIDSISKKPIGSVLIIPRYSSFKVFSFSRNIGYEFVHFYIANPFIYKEGDAFIPTQGKTIGLFPFIGMGSDIQGVLIIAPGYEPIWHWNLWNDIVEINPINGHIETNDKRIVELIPLTYDQSLSNLGYIFELLQRDILVNNERNYWGLGGDYNLEVKFTNNDKEIIHSFMKQSLNDLTKKKLR